MTDVLPMLPELADASYPQAFHGHCTRGLDGKSFAAMLGDANAPQQRQRQYYELQGNRGCISGGWKIVSLQTPVQAIDLDNWTLFNIAADPTRPRRATSPPPNPTCCAVMAIGT